MRSLTSHKCVSFTSSSFFAFPVTKTTDLPAGTAIVENTRRTKTNGPETSGSVQNFDELSCPAYYKSVQSGIGVTRKAVRLGKKASDCHVENLILQKKRILKI